MTSLVAKWAAELAAQDWPGCDSAFGWSFYSQGTREQVSDPNGIVQDRGGNSGGAGGRGGAGGESGRGRRGKAS